jgi:hypothetical protein
VLQRLLSAVQGNNSFYYTKSINILRGRDEEIGCLKDWGKVTELDSSASIPKS